MSRSTKLGRSDSFPYIIVIINTNTPRGLEAISLRLYRLTALLMLLADMYDPSSTTRS